jgi:hypothetical protein
MKMSFTGVMDYFTVITDSSASVTAFMNLHLFMDSDHTLLYTFVLKTANSKVYLTDVSNSNYHAPDVFANSWFGNSPSAAGSGLVADFRTSANGGHLIAPILDDINGNHNIDIVMLDSTCTMVHSAGIHLVGLPTTVGLDSAAAAVFEDIDGNERYHVLVSGELFIYMTLLNDLSAVENYRVWDFNSGNGGSYGLVGATIL